MKIFLILFFLVNLTLASFISPQYSYEVASVVDRIKNSMSEVESFHHQLPVDTLAVMIMFAFETEKGDSNMKFLLCALDKLYLNIAPQTPLDVFVWVLPTELDSRRRELEGKYPSLRVMGIAPESWELPASLGKHSSWVYSAFHHINYFRMGRWRLVFSFEFVRRLGYKYVLQLDDDAYIVEPVLFNIVASFHQQPVLMGLRRKVQTDIKDVLIGLPELAR